VLKQPEYAAGRGSDWTEFAQGLADVAEQAEAAAVARDPDRVLDAGGTLYNVCSACHEVYMPSPVRLAPDPHTNPLP
jgi:cytochrome c2